MAAPCSGSSRTRRGGSTRKGGSRHPRFPPVALVAPSGALHGHEVARRLTGCDLLSLCSETQRWSILRLLLAPCHCRCHQRSGLAGVCGRDPHFNPPAPSGHPHHSPAVAGPAFEPARAAQLRPRGQDVGHLLRGPSRTSSTRARAPPESGSLVLMRLKGKRRVPRIPLPLRQPWSGRRRQRSHHREHRARRTSHELPPAALQ